MNKYRTYLIISILLGGVILGGTFLTTRLIHKKVVSYTIEDYVREQEVIAINLAKTLEDEVENIKTYLTLLLRDEQIRSGSTAECHSALKTAVTSTATKLGNLGRVNSQGNFHCSLNPALVGRRASDLGSYITEIFEDPEHQPVMSPAIKVPGVEGYVTALHIPVFNEKGDFDGTLGGAIYLSYLQERYLEGVTVAEKGFVALYDDDGTVLYNPNEKVIGSNIRSEIFEDNIAAPEAFQGMIDEIKQGKSGVKTYQHKTEGEKIAAFVPVRILEGRHWLLMVTLPLSEVNTNPVSSTVDNFLAQIWIFIAITVLLAETAFIVLTLRYVFRPIKEVEEMKSDFVSLVSHQLKTPVAQIKGYAENMLDGLTGPLTPKQKDYLGDMIRVAHKNSKLIDDLLNVSRIERRMLKINLENLPIAELLNDVLSPLKLVAEQKGVKLVENIPATKAAIVGDTVKTREAVRNIVDNALKFTPVGKSVTVTAKEDATSVTVSIEDEGPGVDPDVQKEIFEKNRVWSGKVKASGAGLGLFLSKQFIELTGGTISFNTTPGKGTVFNINLRKA